MRLIVISLFLAAAAPAAFAQQGSLIGQLGKNAGTTSERSSATLNQIGERTVDSGGLVDQIDPGTVAQIHDVDESLMQEAMPVTAGGGDCDLGQEQKAIFDYLRQEGRVFQDECAMLAWLENETHDKSDRDLYNVMFGPEAERQQQAELERLEAEQAALAARAQLLEAMAQNQQDGS